MTGAVRPPARSPVPEGGPCPSGRRRQHGQATVELALTLPLVALLILLSVDAAVLVRNQLIAVQLAREAARHAAVGEAWSPPVAARVEVRRDGDLVRAHTVIAHDLITPGVGFVGPIELEATATMRAEDPP